MLSIKKSLKKKLVASSLETPSVINKSNGKPVRQSADLSQQQKKQVSRKPGISRKRNNSSIKLAKSPVMARVQSPVESKIALLKREVLNFHKATRKNNVLFLKKPSLKRRVTKEVNILKQEVEDRNSMIIEMFEKGEGSQIFHTIHQALVRRGVGISRLLSNITSSNMVKITDFVESLQQLGIHEGNPIVNILPSVVPTEILFTLYKKHGQPSETESTEKAQVPDRSLKEMSLVMQLYKIPKSQFVSALFGRYSHKKVNKQSLEILLRQSPFHIKDPDVLASFLVDSPKENTITAIGTKLMRYTEDWTIFSLKQEELFNLKLEEIITDYADEIKRACQIYDTSNSGYVSSETVFTIFKRLGISVDVELESYLRSFLFSLSFSASKVPYLQFLDSFTVESEEEVVGMVKRYLEVIARRMIRLNLKTPEVFQTHEGLVFPEDFINGLRKIDIQDMAGGEVMMLVDALQFEGPCERRCVHINDLCELLGCYGVESSLSSQQEDSLDSVIIHNDSSIEDSLVNLSINF